MNKSLRFGTHSRCLPDLVNKDKTQSQNNYLRVSFIKNIYILQKMHFNEF